MRLTRRGPEGDLRAMHLVLVALVALGGLAAVACATPPPRARFIMPPARLEGAGHPSGIASAEATAPRIKEPTPRAVPDVTIAAIGDIMLARRLTTLMEQEGPAYPFERVRDLLEADIAVGNMEGTFTERGAPLVKQYTFRTPMQFAAALRLGELDAVSLANNHATDFGAPGLENTLTAVEQAGVRAFGAGLDAARASTPMVVPAENGARVGFVGIDDIGEVLWAGEGQPGVARADLDTLRTAIEAARSEADYVVVFAHWGTEYSHNPTARQHQLANAAAEAGADLVVGAHPHVLQPVERIDDTLVLYSLGNFVFDLDADDQRSLGEGPFQTVVARVKLSRSAPPHLELTPVRIDPLEHRPRPATTEEAESILNQLNSPLAPTPR